MARTTIEPLSGLPAGGDGGAARKSWERSVVPELKVRKNGARGSQRGGRVACAHARARWGLLRRMAESSRSEDATRLTLRNVGALVMYPVCRVSAERILDVDDTYSWNAASRWNWA